MAEKKMKTKEAMKKSTEEVECAVCGMRAPKSEMYEKGGKYYCSKDCAGEE